MRLPPHPTQLAAKPRRAATPLSWDAEEHAQIIHAAEALMLAGEHERALAVWLALAELEGGRADLLAAAAICSASLGRHDEARAHVAAARAAIPPAAREALAALVAEVAP